MARLMEGYDARAATLETVSRDEQARISAEVDALVMALACREGAAGLERYCAWKGVPAVGVPPAPRGRRTT